MTKKPTRGRPSGFSKNLGEKICEMMATGETLTAICKADNMPTTKMVYRWCVKYQDFRLAYEEARIAQMHAWADQIVSLADDVQADWLRDANGDPVTNDKGEPIRVAENVPRTRLRIDTRRWLMAKILPAVFGDKLAVEAKHTIETADDAELLYRLREAASGAGIDADSLIALLAPDAAPKAAGSGKKSIRIQ